MLALPFKLCFPLASFGGIVGLCLGSSLISLVELIYFFTVRPACAAIRHDNEETKVQPEKIIKVPSKIVLPPPYQVRRAQSRRRNLSLSQKSRSVRESSRGHHVNHSSTSKPISAIEVEEEMVNQTMNGHDSSSEKRVPDDNQEGEGKIMFAYYH
ncbi:hypothetical protein C0J52_28302 [Blattella germanica]|nr:hypothetical protein C0J52_28302 [Blattella germanica]